jgi:hypothetical protein
MYRFLVEKYERKTPLGRPRHIRDDNIKMGLTEMWWKSVDWIHLVYGRKYWQAFANRDSIKCGEYLAYMRTCLASQEGLCSSWLMIQTLSKTSWEICAYYGCSSVSTLITSKFVIANF